MDNRFKAHIFPHTTPVDTCILYVLHAQNPSRQIPVDRSAPCAPYTCTLGPNPTIYPQQMKSVPLLGMALASLMSGDLKVIALASLGQLVQKITVSVAAYS